jgi:predicted NAD/FAD-dependent oxidoreductase
MKENTDLPLVVVGAGLAGLACARSLQEAGIEVLVLEKSRSFGGRCATRRFAGSIVDHGAQYFTMSDPAFAQTVHAAAGEDLREITAPIQRADGSVWQGGRGARYYHRQGQNRLAKSLAGNVEVRMEHTVRELLRQSDGSWQVELEDRAPLAARAVVLTCPGPQTSRLLSTTEPFSTNYEPCLTGLFCLAGEPENLCAQQYGRLDDPEGVLAWSACENHKDGRIAAGFTVLVVQAGPSFSREWLEEDSSRWLDVMQTAVLAAWGMRGAVCTERFGHRWRFARNTRPATPPTLPPGIYLAGDSCTASRVEDAWLSGAALGKTLLAELGRA